MNGYGYCQGHIEGQRKCYKQCSHCKKYYAPLERKRIPRKLKKKQK